jgi:DNA uptake protein ComE-like DNA-binding protein
MRKTGRFTFLAVLMLGGCLCAPGQGQYQDRDSSGAPVTSASAPPPEQRVDINHASITELLKVPGMTSSWAGRIVRFRPYRTKQDLLEMGVVNSKAYDRIKDFVIAHHNKQ